MSQRLDPFDILGLPPRFDLLAAEIEASYLTRVATSHPDALGGASSDPAALNDARAVLLDPEKRANALLLRLGGPKASDDKSLPDGFLFEMMEIRSDIEASIAQGGDTERERWEGWADQRRAGFIERITALFASEDDTKGAIRTQLNAWRYIERLIEQLDPDYDPSHADFG